MGLISRGPYQWEGLIRGGLIRGGLMRGGGGEAAYLGGFLQYVKRLMLKFTQWQSYSECAEHRTLWPGSTNTLGSLAPNTMKTSACSG